MKKLDGTIVTGIWNYDPSIVFTEGDYVIYSNHLYYVKSPEVSGITPSITSTDYEWYNNLNATVTPEDFVDVNKRVTVGGARTLIRSFFKGYTHTGSIETLTGIDLNTLTETGAYYVDPSSINLPVDPTETPSSYLIKIYSDLSLTIQEVINPVSGALFYRSYSGTWNSWKHYSFNSTVTDLDNLISSIETKLNTLTEINNINLSTYYEVELIDDFLPLGVTNYYMPPIYWNKYDSFRLFIEYDGLIRSVEVLKSDYEYNFEAVHFQIYFASRWFRMYGTARLLKIYGLCSKS